MARMALVTGAAGFTGSRMVELLDDRGWAVIATDLEETAREQYYVETDNAPHPHYDRSTVEGRDVPFMAADLTERETIEPIFAEFDIDIVIHTASLFDYFAEWDALKAVNIDGTRNLAAVAGEVSVDHFLQISTLGVLGDTGFDGPVDETAPYDPHNEYGRSKQRQEEVIWDAAGEGLPVTVVRPAPIYGPGNFYGVFHIPLIIAKMGFAPQWRIYPRSRQLKFPSVHVDDLARALLFLAERPDETIGETYHVLSDPIDQDELIALCAEGVGVPTIRVPIPFAAYRLLSRYARWHARRIDAYARARDERPKVDAPMTAYLTQNMWYSNEKIRSLDFEFEYRDAKKGLWQFITHCKAEGRLP